MQSVNRLVNWLGFDSKLSVAGIGADELKSIKNNKLILIDVFIQIKRNIAKIILIPISWLLIIIYFNVMKMYWESWQKYCIFEKYTMYIVIKNHS